MANANSKNKQPSASKKSPGRKPEINPKVFMINFRLNEKEHDRFLSLWEQTGLKSKSRFILSCLFDKPIKVIQVDKSAMDICAKLSETNRQIRSVGVNYNQLVRMIKTTFGEKKALAFLYKLEKSTIELVELNKQIIALIEKYEQQWLQK